jgi:hypothetical protein
VPKGAWPGLVDEDSKPVATSVALAIDVAQDRKHAAISAASLRADGKVHLEVVAHRTGTDWVVPAMARLHSCGLRWPWRSPPRAPRPAR